MEVEMEAFLKIWMFYTSKQLQSSIEPLANLDDVSIQEYLYRKLGETFHNVSEC
jgi:hypothetical protein